MKHIERGRKKGHKKIVSIFLKKELILPSKQYVYDILWELSLQIPDIFNMAPNNLIRMQLKFNFNDACRILLMI